MGISNSLLAYYPKLDPGNKKIFFQNIFLILQLIGFLIAILLFFTKGFGLIKNDSLLTSRGIFLLALYIFLYSPTLLVEIKFILNKESSKLKFYGIAVFSLQLLIVLIAAILYRDINLVLIALVIWIFIRWLYTIYIVFNFSMTFGISINLAKVFLLFSVPVIIHIFLGNGMEYIDGIIVGQKFSPDMFSVYRYGAREFPLILILIGSLRSTMIPEAVENPEIAYKKIKNQTSKIIKLYFPLAIILMLSSKYLYSFFYSPQYSYSAVLFNIYLLIITSRIIMPEVFIYANHENKLFMKVSFVELLANVVLSLILLQFWGIAGIAFATFISFMGSKLYLVYFVKKEINISLRKYLDLRLYAIYTILLYVSFLISVFYR